MVWYGMVRYGMVWYGLVWYRTVRYGMVWYGMVRYGTVRYGSNISPVHKKSDETDKTNYRPVSVLSALSKIYEKVMFDQMYSAIHPHLSLNLSGFLKGHSCCTALLKMTDDWRGNLDDRKHVAAVTVDLSKAFDSVCHNLMLAKLKAYGFSEAGIELMKAYLHDRRQRVKVNGTY